MGDPLQPIDHVIISKKKAGFRGGKCKNSQAKIWDERRGSVGDPEGILRGSEAKTGDPVGIAPMFCGGSSATNIPFYNIKRGNEVLEVAFWSPRCSYVVLFRSFDSRTSQQPVGWLRSQDGPSNAAWILEMYLTWLSRVHLEFYNTQCLSDASHAAYPSLRLVQITRIADRPHDI